MLKRLALALSVLLPISALAGVIALPGRHGHVVTPPPPPPPNNNVYAGCNIPGGGTGTTWYIDSVNGTTQVAGADGSQAKPWNSLQAVWGTKTNGVFGPAPGYNRPLLSSVTEGVGGGTGPIHPGDTILVMNGNYGSVGIGDFDNEVTNSDWVTVKAHPGQMPVVQSLNITRTNKTIFDGLKVQSTAPVNGGYLVAVSDQGASYPTTDIVLRNLDVSSMDHPASIGLSQQTLSTDFAIGMASLGSAGNGTNGVPYTTCVSFVNNKIHDVKQGLIVASNSSLVTGNEISYFGDDGLDYAGIGIAITHNYEHDVFSLNDGNHQDAMQGQVGALASGVAYNKYGNILIDSNIVIRQTDPNLQYPSYLQGIDAFDEDWTTFTVTNNVVVTSSCYGFVFGSIHNALIADNTAVNDGQVVSSGCAPQINIQNTTHEGLPSTNVQVSNNTASQYFLYTTPTNGVISDHTIIIPLAGQGGATVAWEVGGSPVFLNSPGTYTNSDNGSTVTISSAGPAATYVNYSPSTYTYDLHPLSTGPLAGAGTSGSPLPSIDITGVDRAQPYDVGAYTRPQVFALPTGDVVHYMSASGNDSNNGTSPATPWLTPNHSLHCGDVIIAAAGSYGYQSNWGTVSNCPSTSGGIDGNGGVYFAVLLCGGADLTSCNDNGQRIAASNWAVEGFSSTHPGAFCHLADASATGTTQYAYVAFINEIAYNCDDGYTTGDGGKNHNVPGNGVDEFAVVGDIAQNSNHDPICVAAIDDPGPSASQSFSGTHVFFDGNFGIANTGNPGCAIDGEAYMFDTFDAHGYNGQAVMENNIGYLSARYGINLFQQNNNTTTTPMFVFNNTLFDNNSTTYSLNDNGGCGDLNSQGQANGYVISLYNNVVLTNYARRGGVSTNCYVYAALEGGLYSDTWGGVGLQNIFLGEAAHCSASCDSTNSAIAFNTTYATAYGSNAAIYENPFFNNTADLLANHTGVPNCAGFTTTTACMGWSYTTQMAANLSVIYDLTPSASGTAGKGYQPPHPCAADSYYPSWLKGIVYLQWNSATSTITENGGLVNKPCQM